MNEKDKAKELVEKFEDFADPQYHECATQRQLRISTKENAKECAKIAVEEIIEVVQNVFEAYEERNYWEGVLKEIDLI